MVNILHYSLLSQFNDIFYEGLLKITDIDSEIHLKKISLPDGDTVDGFNFWGYLIIKDNKKFLLSDHFPDGKQLVIQDVFPIKPKETQKVSSGGVIFYHITKPSSFKIRPIKSFSFRMLVDLLSSMKSSNPDHHKLMWFIGLTTMYDRANFRISTPPGFGKDSVVDILGNLVGGCSTIENPTIAKLEERANSLKWLAINEVVGISGSAWKDIELFLLATGAHKPKVTKRSRSFGAVGEEIDISRFSLSLMYNDIDCYPDEEKYLDNFSKKAVLDRFPPIRLHGKLTEDFDAIRKINVPAYVEKNRETYEGIIRNFLYYKENIDKYVNNYDQSRLKKLTGRWKLNIGKLMKLIDVYCQDQKEFDKWVDVINASMEDYLDMIAYPPLYTQVLKKIGDSAFINVQKKIHDMPTFTQKNQYLQQVLRSGMVIQDENIWKFDEEIL